MSDPQQGTHSSAMHKLSQSHVAINDSGVGVLVLITLAPRSQYICTIHQEK